MLLAACMTPPQKPSVSLPAPVAATPPSVKAPASAKPADYLRIAAFSDLPGWTQDDVRQSWPAMLATCQALGQRLEWQEVCRLAAEVNPSDEAMVRRYYETQFVPHQVRNLDGNTQGMATGYYEPLLRGSRSRTGSYQTALYRDRKSTRLNSSH